MDKRDSRQAAGARRARWVGMFSVLAGLALSSSACGEPEDGREKIQNLIRSAACSDTLGARYSPAEGEVFRLDHGQLVYRVRHRRSARLYPPDRVFWETLTFSAPLRALDPASIDVENVGSCQIVSGWCRQDGEHAAPAAEQNHCVTTRVRGPDLENTRYQARIDLYFSQQEDGDALRSQIATLVEAAGNRRQLPPR